MVFGTIVEFATSPIKAFSSSLGSVFGDTPVIGGVFGDGGSPFSSPVLGFGSN